MTSRLARLPSSHPRLHRPRSVSCSASDNYRRPSGSGGSRRRRDDSLFDNIEPGASSNSSSAATIDATPIDIEDTAPPSTSTSTSPSTPPTSTMGQQDDDDNEWAGWGPFTSTSAGTAANADPELGWANESWSQPARNMDNNNDNYTNRSSSSSNASQSNNNNNGAPRQPRSKDIDEYNNNNTTNGEAYAPTYEEGLEEPDIAVLTSDEVDRVLPVVPFSQQATYFSGSTTENIQRWGASLAATVVLSKIALIAAGTLTWPLWWPWALAAKRNYGLRKSSGNGGLWRTQILDISITGRPKPKFGSGNDSGGDEGSAAKAKRSFFTTMRTTKLLIGDPGGAQTELVLPYDARHDRLMPGQPAEMIVLSSAPTFESFKAVPEVYLPFASLWVSEYPHVARNEFLELSLQIERERKEEEEGGNRGWYDDNGAGRPPPSSSSFGVRGNGSAREYYY